MKLALAIVALLAGGSFALAQSAPTNSLPNPYRSIENWGQLPDGRKWGSTSAVAIDPDGTSVWVGERCGEARPPSQINPGAPFACAESSLDPILKFDASGKLLKSFGAGLILFPHGLHVDRDGNVWVTDGLGRNGKGHQVFKFARTESCCSHSARLDSLAAAPTSSMHRPPSSPRRTAISSSPTGMAETPTRAS